MEKKGSFDDFAASQMGTVDCFCICTVLYQAVLVHDQGSCALQQPILEYLQSWCVFFARAFRSCWCMTMIPAARPDSSWICTAANLQAPSDQQKKRRAPQAAQSHPGESNAFHMLDFTSYVLEELPMLLSSLYASRI